MESWGLQQRPGTHIPISPRLAHSPPFFPRKVKTSRCSGTRFLSAPRSPDCGSEDPEAPFSPTFVKSQTSQPTSFNEPSHQLQPEDAPSPAHPKGPGESALREGWLGLQSRPSTSCPFTDSQPGRTQRIGGSRALVPPTLWENSMDV